MDELFKSSEFYRSLDDYNDQEKQEAIQFASEQKEYFNRNVTNDNELILSI